MYIACKQMWKILFLGKIKRQQQQALEITGKGKAQRVDIHQE